MQETPPRKVEEWARGRLETRGPACWGNWGIMEKNIIVTLHARAVVLISFVRRIWQRVKKLTEVLCFIKLSCWRVQVSWLFEVLHSYCAPFCQVLSYDCTSSCNMTHIYYIFVKAVCWGRLKCPQKCQNQKGLICDLSFVV
jgi:hypothetical protein